MPEENSLGGRVRRYAKVTTAMGGLAARLAGERYLGLKIERQEHAEELRTALGSLKGPLMKVAQMLATIPDAVPQEYVGELSQLQSDAPSMGWAFVKRRMRAELGPDWETKFKSFGQEAVSAASLGQVHRAVGPNGEDLACKLQYPDMSSAVEADLRQLRIILALFERYDRAVSTKQVQQEIADRLREELDYRLEAKHIALYRHILQEEPRAFVPDVYPELSSPRLLTMGWMEGSKLLDAVQGASQERRNEIAETMFRAWYIPFYRYGVIHGDPHLGNYTVRGEEGVNLLDFGCVRKFPARFVGGVIDLYKALQTGDDALAVHAYSTWGFTAPSKEVVEILNQWARFIYAPLLEDRPHRIEETHNGVYGRETARKVHRQLREAGGVEVPKEFVFMDRSTVGLGSVFLHCRAEINWYRLFHELIEGYDTAALQQRQDAAMAAAGLPPVV